MAPRAILLLAGSVRLTSQESSLRINTIWQQKRSLSLLDSVSNLRKQNSSSQNSLPASYYRGGTSRAIFFRRDDLPQDTKRWESIFLGAIGSPDPYGRQLDGLGGGISSLSKVCVVGKSEHPEADVDYTFVSLGIRDKSVDYSSNCGNMSAAVGPFAVDANLMPSISDQDTEATVRILNTNTGKVIHATFPIIHGEAAASGEYSIDGVAGEAARVQLDFMKPAGSRTGKLLPTGNAIDQIAGVRATLIDAGNPCCFVAAADLNVEGSLSSQQIDDNIELKKKLEEIRRESAVKMGLAKTIDNVPGSVPKIGFVSAPKDAAQGNVVVRAMSVGQPHKAIPVTVALAVAAASKIAGSTVAESVISSDAKSSIIDIAHASGKLAVAAQFDPDGQLDRASVFRTARRLMEGRVFWK